MCAGITPQLVILTGLCLDGAGAFLLAVPDLSLLSQFTTPEDEIDRIEAAREELFHHESLESDDPGFNDVVDIFREHLDLPGEVIEIVAVDPGKLGGSAVVEPRYVSEEADHEYAKPQVNNLPSRTLVDHWIERHIRRREREEEAVFFRWGVRLLLVGFLLQIGATAGQII